MPLNAKCVFSPNGAGHQSPGQARNERSPGSWWERERALKARDNTPAEREIVVPPFQGCSAFPQQPRAALVPRLPWALMSRPVGAEDMPWLRRHRKASAGIPAWIPVACHSQFRSVPAPRKKSSFAPVAKKRRFCISISAARHQRGRGTARTPPRFRRVCPQLLVEQSYEKRT